MKKLAKLTALTMTAGMLLAACGDTTDTDMEDPATETDTGTDTETDTGTDTGTDTETDTETDTDTDSDE